MLIYFKDTDSAAPAVSGESGKLIGLLDAALVVNKVFSTDTDDTPFVDNSVEARLEGGTAFTLFSTPADADKTYIGMPCKFSRVKIAFATAAVGGTIAFEYWNGSAWTALVSPTDGTSALTADGTITWTIASQTGWVASSVNSVTQFWIRIRAATVPSTNPTVNYITVGGWTRAYTGTNKAAYRQGAGSNGFLLRVDDSGTATSARCVGYESMSDIDTGVAPFPTAAQVSGGLFFTKSSAASATARPYIIACSDRLLLLAINQDSSATWLATAISAFGDLKSYKSGDAFHTAIMADTSLAAGNFSTNSNVGNVTGHFLARTYTQLGASVTCSKHGDGGLANSVTASLGTAGLTYPHPVDGGLYMSPLFVRESTALVRGQLPGYWCPLHAKPLTSLDTFSGTGTLAGKTFIAFNCPASGQVFLESSDTWDQ